MDSTVTGELMLILIGLGAGYLLGRTRSEVGRGRHDARRAWRQRRDYRRKRR